MSRTILIVEDSCALREMLGKALAARGWSPILAESGRKALYKLQCEIPNVILTDIRMPDMNGFELVATLKKHSVYRNIPILAVTGYPAYVARQQCLLTGCDDFITKPFALSALEICLNTLLSLEKPKAIVR